MDRAWDLAPQVSVRPEAFGALLYHFGTRRLSFLKDRRLLDVVQSLGEAPTARAACADAGIGPGELGAYERALVRLAETDMLRERTS
jgi:putative mycofactocin binding protein MftB